MQKIEVFKVKCTNLTPQNYIYIETETLSPGNYFLPEERLEIAAIHAQHIETYLRGRTSMFPLLIMLKVGQINPNKNNIEAKGTETKTFKRHNGNEVLVQTLFSPINYTSSIAEEKNIQIKYIRFNGYGYKHSKI